MQQRYYDPVALRFLSPDPVDVSASDGGNFNRYWYANNNPYKFTDPDGRSVRFEDGATEDYRQEFSDAIQYLNSGQAAGNIAALERLDEVVYIKQPDDGSNQMYYNPETKTIVWDAKSALETSDGGKQTPALGLGHEAEHALGILTGTADSLTPTNDGYTHAEERRVITGYESRAAIRLGEATRTNHGGRAYQVRCSTCIE
jgi:hypothetical protein